MAHGPSSSPASAGLNRKFHGCSSIKDYDVMDKLGEGTFGEVYKAKSRKTGATVALKKILMHNEKDGFPITALREIKLLKMLSHVNVLKLEEMAVERNKAAPGEGRKRAVLYMVTPYMDHDLSGLLDNHEVRMTVPQIKCYMLQLLEGLRYLHDSSILHRDMKAANLLINNRGILQIADFGLARHYDEPVPRKGKGGGEAHRDYTSLVVTRWYRPPELLLQLRRYTTAIDMWGAGCVFGEMFKRKPILTGNSDLNQIQIIFDLVGAPTEESMPGWRDLPGCDGVREFAPRRGSLAHVFNDQGREAVSLLYDLLRLDWRKRINAIDALEHPYFKTPPFPARPEDLPRFHDSHELDRRRGNKAAPPPAPAGGTVGMGPNGEWTGAGPPQSSGIWMNGPDRSGRGFQDRGPPGMSRVPGAGPSYDRGPPLPPGHRRAPWGGDGHRHGHGGPPPPESVRHPLPHAPHPPYGGGYGGDRDRGGRVTMGAKDTYVPRYSDGGRGREDRRSRERSLDRRSRSRDRQDWRGHPFQDDRAGGRRGSIQSDRSGNGRNGSHDERSERGGRSQEERDFYRDRRDHRYVDRDRRHTRSRSPDRERDYNSRRDRERELYRR
ncbi:kinase-like domain-containing protein [Lineolata rhizophorae]|uniref:Serine/threonine-protein kinase BUR1 n=1 Tax=Lineolata rhizophorae TaxID=578093 RepID=A0A6A6NZA2_9PEZI|nr:kinase-like domain-containing protein [Lineolata rhizophorae]